MEEWDVQSGGGDDWVPGSPQPFVNTRYQLAGGMDTPTLAAAQAQEQEGSEYPDAGYRKHLGGDSNNGMERHTRRGLFGEHEGPSYFALEREANGRGRGYHDGSNHQGWSKGAINVVGAVVGKVWEFCKIGATTFTGFGAGAGTKYKVNAESMSHFEPVEVGDSYWESEKNLYGEDRDSTPVPGQFPEQDFIPDYMDRATPDVSPAPPAKRRQISNSHSSDEIAKNWVVVPNKSNPSTSTPTRPQPRAPSRYSMPTASSASRRSVAGVARPASRAGYASPAVRRQMLNRTSHAGSATLQSNRGASFASSRSPAPASRIPRASPVRDVKSPGKPAVVQDSPAAREAQRWAALKRKEEREADESIRRLDAQLKAMIREGKEALGTKIEVEMDDDDDDFNSGTKKWAF